MTEPAEDPQHPDLPEWVVSERQAHDAPAEQESPGVDDEAAAEDAEAELD